MPRNALNVWKGYEVPAVALERLRESILDTRGQLPMLELARSVEPQLIPVAPWRDTSRFDAACAVVDSCIFDAFRKGHVYKVTDPYGRPAGWKRPRDAFVWSGGKWVRKC